MTFSSNYVSVWIFRSGQWKIQRAGGPGPPSVPPRPSPAAVTARAAAAWPDPDRPGLYHAAFLITALATEMTDFARSRLLSGLADTARSIGLTQGTPRSVSVDGDPVLGWALLANGATGIACGHRDRVFMWLGTGQAVIPESIYTKSVGGLRMSGRIL